MYSKLFKFDQICKTMIPDDLQIDYMTERATWLRELPWAVMFRQCQNQFAEHAHFWVTFGHLDATFWLVCARLFSKSVWIAGLRTWSKWTPNMKIWLSHVPHSKPRTPRRMHISSRPLTLTKSRLIRLISFSQLVWSALGLLTAMATELKNCLVKTPLWFFEDQKP